MALIEDLIVFMDSGGVLPIVIRAVVIYLFIIFAVRITGKRGIGQATALDFIIAIAIGDVIGDMAYGTENILKGFGIVVVWIAMHGLMAYLEIKVPTIERLASGTKTLVIDDGKILKKKLHKEQVSENELKEMLRHHSMRRRRIFRA